MGTAMRGISVTGGFFITVILFLLLTCNTVSSAESDPFEQGLKAYNEGDYQAAYKIIAPMATNGDPAVLNLLGLMYEQGLGVPQNAEKSVALYREAADKGYSYAQYNLAVSYDTGVGIPINYREAVRWYKRAAKQGASVAQYNLGVMYEQGRGTAKDYKQAAFWYEKAAKQGHKQAQNNLAWLYETGQGLDHDLVSAYAWFNIAAEQGLETAARKRDIIKRQLAGNELTRAINITDKLKKVIAENSN